MSDPSLCVCRVLVPFLLALGYRPLVRLALPFTVVSQVKPCLLVFFLQHSRTFKMQLRDLLASVMLGAAPIVHESSISPLHARSTYTIHDRSSLLTSVGLDHDVVAFSPPSMSANPALGLSVLATGDCDPGWTVCGSGCMPIGSVCCTGNGYCDAGEYCTSDSACCKVTALGSRPRLGASY